MQQASGTHSAPAGKPTPTAHPAHLGWRMLAMVYDLFPSLALWFVACYAIELTHRAQSMKALHADVLGGYVELLLLWLIPGIYAVASWRRGGQTIGMRPWRLKVVAPDGQAASLRALCLRYVVATLSVFVLGIGMLWSLFDHERRCWHDLAAGTRFVRLDRIA